MLSDPVVRSPFQDDYFAFRIYVALCLAIAHDRQSLAISPDDMSSNAKLRESQAQKVLHKAKLGHN